MNRIIGIENELILCGNGVDENNKFGALVDDIAKYTGKPYHTFAEHTGFMLWNGTVVYSDGGTAEVTSAASEIQKGCVTECVNSLFSARNMLFEGLDKYNRDNGIAISMGAYSGHYNFSIERGEYDRLFSLIKNSIGMAYMLFVEKKNSRGVMVRDKGDRVEICGEYLPAYEQNIAAMAFMLGTINALRDENVTLPFQLKCRKRRSRYAYDDEVLWPLTYAPSFLKRGRDSMVTAVLRNKKTQKMKAQKVLEEYFAFFKEDIQKIAPLEVNILEDYVKGNRQLIIDKTGTPEHYKPADKSMDVDMQPKGIAQYFARAVKDREQVRNFTLKTTSRYWDKIEFYLRRDEPIYTYPINVARGMLERFYSDMDSLKKCNEPKKFDVFLKNVRNAYYSGEPHPDYYTGRGGEE